MKICFFSHGSGTNQDGATLSMLNIMEELANRGHQVIGIMAKDVNLQSMKQIRNVKFYFIPSYDMRLDLSMVGPKIELKYFIKNKLNWFIMKKTMKMIRNEGIDIIHINGINNGIGAIIAKKLGIPYVWHIRQLMQEDLHQRLYNKRQVWPLIESANVVIAISKVVKDKFQNEFQRDIKVIYNGIPVENYQIRDHEIFNNKIIRLILPGRIVKGKGQLDAVKAINYLVQEGITDIKLILVGHKQGNYSDIVQSFIKDNNLSNYVELREHVSDLREIRKTCDIGLTCSVKEAFGRVTVENQMAGLLVIGADSGGTLELIKHGTTGLLYQQGNYENLAEQIKYAFFNKKIVKQIAYNGYKNSIEKFSIKRVVDQVEEVYRAMLTD